MRIEIPGEPAQQQRMRHFVRGGFAQVYDPDKKEKDFLKSYLESFLTENYPEYVFPKYPKISFYFYCSIPKSFPKKNLELAKKGFVRKITKPDTDNYIKLYLDCMNKILLQDDCQAIIGDAEKFYHAEPKTIIYIDECEEIIRMPACGYPHFSESYELIRATTIHQRELFSRPYLDALQFPELIPPTHSISSFHPKSGTQLNLW